MTVKDDLIQWIITNKNTEIEDLGTYVQFRAGEAAGDLSTNINNVRKALGTLKEEGLVVNPEHGWWAWTGETPVESEKAPRKRRSSNGVSAQAKAAQSVLEVISGIESKRQKITARIAFLQSEMDSLEAESDALDEQESIIRSAYDALAVKE